MACLNVVIMVIMISNHVAAENTLRFVSAVWRHGDRATTGNFPTDTDNDESSWPQGFGELSTDGMRQQQKLGVYLRKRYVDELGFLSSDYKAKEIYVRSTSYNRTIMSAQSNMAGLYPAPTELFENSTWQPIPVHSQPKAYDPMLVTDCPCPVADSVYDEIMQSDEVKRIEDENRDFLEFLRVNTGMERMTLDDLGSVWDPLFCEMMHNDTHKWPSWVTDDIFDRLTILKDIALTFSFHDQRIQRFRGSLLFNDIATRMEQKAYRPSELRPAELKFYVYSAHDTTVMSILENLGAYVGDHAKQPVYASMVLFELHEIQKGNFIVRTFYSNDSWHTTDPTRIAVQDCDGVREECPLEKFSELAAARVPDDWFAECNPAVVPVQRSDCEQQKEAATIAAIVLGVATGLLLIALLVTVIKYRSYKKRKVIQVSDYN